MTKRRLIATATAGVALIAAGGAGFVAATTGAADDDARQPQVVGPEASTESLPDPLRAILHRSDSAVSEFQLDPSAAYGVPLRTRAGHAWVVPGKVGTCLFIGAGGGGCAEAEEVAAGGLVVVAPPAPESIEDVKPGDKMRLAPGSATLVGLAPDGVTAANVLDEEGRVVAHVRPSASVYELSLAQGDGWSLEADWSVELERGANASPLAVGL